MLKHIEKVKNNIHKKMDTVPLWAEFTLFLAAIMIMLTIVQSFTIYRWERKRTIDSQVASTKRLLELKMTIMKDYLDSLSDYAILPVYDSSLYSTLLSNGELTDESIEDVRTAVRTYFYSRKGLLSYHIYLLNHDISVGRDNGKDGIRVRTIDDMKDTEIYKACASNSRNYAVFPSDDSEVLFHFVHAIIRIQDKSIVALTDMEVDRRTMGYLSSQSVVPNEVLSLYNTEGRLLYTDADDDLHDILASHTPEENRDLFLPLASYEKAVYRKIDGVEYLLNVATDTDDTLIMTSLLPLPDVLSQVRKVRYYAAMIGIIFLIVAVTAAYILIRYLSAPLTALVSMQERYGKGEVSRAMLGRSREGAELGRSFNRMTERIDTLIKENYAAELNEKNARLAALEAQVNPHFLYNTLQAIGSEALLNDQTAIYNMLLSLAANLRYTIKAPNVVSLRDELKYVDNYIMLQEIRMEDRLSVTRHIDEAALDCLVPKICIQTLVENSIIHGIGGDRASIHIDLTVEADSGGIYIKVLDDGIGITDNELAEIRGSFHLQTLTDANQGIGLANLYNRLTILYGGEADINIDSSTGEQSYTMVALILPEKRRGEEVVQDTDNR